MRIMSEAFQRATSRAVSREQMALDERTRFEEMGMYPGSAIEDNFPFKIVLMNPDGNAPSPHAHIYGKGRRGKEIGTFIITPNPPRKVEDLVPYVVGRHEGLRNIPMEWRRMIVDWAGKKSHLDKFRTNWEHLQRQFYNNAYLTRTEL